MNPNPLVNFRIRHISEQAAQKTVAVVREKIAELARLRKIDAAHVSIERERELAPGFRVHVHLETPGPDIRAEGRDYTLLAAAIRTLVELHRQVRSRNSKRRDLAHERNAQPRLLRGRVAGSTAHG